MRNAFAAELTALAKEDPRVVMLSGDIGNRLFDEYKSVARSRFFNCGVAEANLISMGAGLAMSGFRPIAYTIAPFITTRCYEQIRVDVCYHESPVVIVGVGAGLSYASLGATHHSCEDIAIMRALPHMTVMCPGDEKEVRAALRAAIAHNGPSYIRIGKKGEPVVHKTPPAFTIGKGIELKTGTDVCLLSTGTLLPEVIAAAELLEKEKLSVRVVSLHTVKPLDEALIFDAFKRYQLVATIEEHSVIGGLGGAVSELIAETSPAQRRAQFVRIGTPDVFLHEPGEQEFAREHFGLNAKGIAAKIRSSLRNAE
jgi:transketolase